MFVTVYFHVVYEQMNMQYLLFKGIFHGLSILFFGWLLLIFFPCYNPFFPDELMQLLTNDLWYSFLVSSTYICYIVYHICIEFINILKKNNNVTKCLWANMIYTVFILAHRHLVTSKNIIFVMIEFFIPTIKSCIFWNWIAQEWERTTPILIYVIFLMSVWNFFIVGAFVSYL